MDEAAAQRSERQVLGHVEALVAEEHRLLAQNALSDAERAHVRPPGVVEKYVG